MGLNRSQYARWRKERGLPGQTSQAVQLMITSGRLRDALLGDQTIDPIKADLEVAAKTRTRTRNGLKVGSAVGRRTPGPKPTVRPPETRVDLPEGIPTTFPSDPAAGYLIEEAERLRTCWQAEKARIEVELLRADVVRVADVSSAVHTFVRSERDGLIGLPARVCHAGAAKLGVDAAELRAWLGSVLREYLADSAGRALKLGAAVQ